MSLSSGGAPIQHWWEPHPHIKKTMDGIAVAVVAVVVLLLIVYFFLILLAVVWQGYIVATGNMWLTSAVSLLLALGVYLCIRK